MKKLLFLLLMVLMGCAGVRKTPEQASLQRVLEVPGMTGSQVFDKSYSWVVKYMNLQSANPSTGAIVARGEVAYPSPPPDRVEYTIVFRMKNQAADNRDVVTFDNVMLKAPRQYSLEATRMSPSFTGGEETSMTSPGDAAVADAVFNILADNLKQYLQR